MKAMPIWSSMTKENKHGLGKFVVVESSEQGMLAQVEARLCRARSRSCSSAGSRIR